MLVDFILDDNYRGLPRDIFSVTNAKLGRQTFIYGRNGSGKTTISEALREYGVKGSDSLGITFKVVEAGAVVTKKWPPGQCPFQFHVFNRFYVEENLSPFIKGESDARGLVYIGSASVDASEKIEEISSTLARLERAEGRLKKLETHAKRDQETVLRGAQADIIGALANSNPGRYTTQGFNIGQVRKVLQSSPASLSSAEYARHLAAAKSSSFNTIPLLVSPVFDEKYSPEVTNRDVLAPVPKQVAVQELQSDSALEKWVEEGIALHSAGEECKFCTAGSYSNARDEELRKHFSDDFNLLRASARDGAGGVQKYIEDLEALKGTISNLQEVELLDREEGWTQDIEAALKETASAISAAEVGLRLLERKHESPSDVLCWDRETSDIRVDVSEVNKSIDAHNRAVSNVTTIKAQGEAAIESHYVAGVEGAHAKLGRKIARIRSFLEAIDGYSGNLELRRNELRAEMENTEELARQIDSDVRYVFGHHKLQVVTADDGKGYRILRNGGPAVNLSEGEGNAIAYAYFVNSLRADGVDLNNPIVVVDDPVTSLDKDALFAGYSLTMDRIRPARQVIIMTHDFDYFRLLLHAETPDRIVEIDGASEKATDKDKIFPRQSVLELLHGTSRAEPRLRRIETNQGKALSEYHYLFNLISSAILAADESEDLRLYGNAGRRLLEGFIAFRAPQKSDFQARVSYVADSCAQSISAELCGRIVKFLHAGSHRTDPSPDSSLDMASIIEDLSATMEFMAMADPVHFSGMCTAVNVNEGQLMDIVALGGK